MWNPITCESLKSIIQTSEAAMPEYTKRVWNLIRVQPSKWEQVPFGEQGNGFWIVGVCGQRVIWYNDIELGFNISRFREYGKINEYGSELLDLHHLLNRELGIDTDANLGLPKKPD